MILDALLRTPYDDCNKVTTYSIFGATILVILGWIVLIGYSKIETDVYDYFDSVICTDDDKIYWKQIEKYDNMSLLLSLRNWKFVEKSNIDYSKPDTHEFTSVGLHDFSRPDFDIICAQIDIENNMRIIIREHILFYPERRNMICQGDIKSLPTCRDYLGKALGNSFFFKDEYLTSFDPVDFLYQLSLRRYLFK